MRIRLLKFRVRFGMKKQMNPYQMLGVEQGASEDDIKSAYYRMAKLYHPDVQPQNVEKFKEISEAYSILKDPAKKQDFDSISERFKCREDIKEVHKSYYYTRYHYGHTYKNAKQTQGKPKSYQNNPFGSGNDQVFDNQFIKDVFKNNNEEHRKSNIKALNNSVKWVFIGMGSLVGIAILMQMFLRIYKFNHLQQKEVEIGSKGERKVNQQYF